MIFPELTSTVQFLCALAVLALGEDGRAAAHGARAAAGGGAAAPGRVAAQVGAAGVRPVPPGEGPQGRRGSEEVRDAALLIRQDDVA